MTGSSRRIGHFPSGSHAVYTLPKLKASAIGVMLIPALYALIHLRSVQDHSAHTGALRAAIVNLDRGLDFRGQSVNIGEGVVASLKEKHSFGFVDYQIEEDAKRAVRQGQLAFALIIPRDFSANAMPGNTVAGGRLVMYISEGNNYNGAQPGQTVRHRAWAPSQY